MSNPTPPSPGRDTHVVPDDATPDRLDRYAARVLERLVSRSQAWLACRRGLLLLNGETASPDVRVKVGDRLELWGGGRRQLPVVDRALPVAWLDDHVAVVVKPPGLLTSGDGRFTLANCLPSFLPPSPEPDALARPWPAHRLDTATQGLVAVGRTERGLAGLGRLFEDHGVHKRYVALCAGRLEGEGIVDLPLEGQEARTRWQVVSVGPCLPFGHLTTVLCFPETGRTHQVRRHLASLGTPILGDDRYAPPERLFKGRGLFLAATGLVFDHPVTGERVDVSIPEPPKFESHRRWEAARVGRFG